MGNWTFHNFIKHFDIQNKPSNYFMKNLQFWGIFFNKADTVIINMKQNSFEKILKIISAFRVIKLCENNRSFSIVSP